jgi:alpha-galactosidase
LPAAMLESYVERWPTARIENFRYMLRSGMLGWFTLMLDASAWSAEQHAAAKQQIEIYKTWLRPLIRDGDLYHVSARPDGVHWDGIEYFDPRRGAGVVYTFRGSTPDEAEHDFPLHGLSPEAAYSVRFQDGSSPDSVMSGSALLSPGLRVKLAYPNSSELIFLQETAAAPR